MFAFPDPPSTPPPGDSTRPTPSTPVKVMKSKSFEDPSDPAMSSDDELMRGPPPKKIKLKHVPSADEPEIPEHLLWTSDSDPPEDGIAADESMRRPPLKKIKLKHVPFTNDPEIAKHLVRTDDSDPAEDETSADNSAPSEGPVIPAAPTDIAIERGVATPPATSPALGPSEDTPVAITETAVVSPKSASPVPDAAAAEPPNSPSPSPVPGWDASNYPVFCPDDDKEFGPDESGAGVISDSYDFKNYIMELDYHYSFSKYLPHLHECLRGSARDWWDGLSDDERKTMRYGCLEHFLDCLCWAFPPDSQEYLDIIRYNPWDWVSVRKGRSIEGWLEGLFGLAERCHDEHWEALHIIWQQIDPVMRKDVPEPDENTVYDGFLFDLESAVKVWKYILRYKGLRWG